MGTIITLKFPDVCKECGAELSVGDCAYYYGKNGTYGTDCHSRIGVLNKEPKEPRSMEHNQGVGPAAADRGFRCDTVQCQSGSEDEVGELNDEIEVLYREKKALEEKFKIEKNAANRQIFSLDVEIKKRILKSDVSELLCSFPKETLRDVWNKCDDEMKGSDIGKLLRELIRRG